MADTVYGVRYYDCGCTDVHRHGNRADASFWANYQNGQLMSSSDNGATWDTVD